jgi:adenosylcobinamide-phosphate synthase
MPDRVRMLVVTVALDAIAGEVGGAWHPVAVAGRLLDAAYEPWWRRPPLVELGGGAVSLTGVAVAVAALGRGAERLAARGRPGMLIAGAALKQTLSIRCLLEEGSSVAAALERDRLEDARLRLRALVSRPTAELDAALCASAAIQSLAENLADSVAAPLLLHALLGLPVAAAYRVVNMADAMRRSPASPSPC